DVKFVCAEPVGTQRVKALITTRPLTLAGLNLAEAPKAGAGQGVPFQFNPAQEEQIKSILLDVFQKEGKGKKTPEQVEQLTGVKVKELPFEFSMDEVGFYVGTVKSDVKDKP